VASVRGESGLEVVGVNTEGDFEFLGFRAKIGFGVTGANWMRVSGGHERRGEDQAEERIQA
jgi:hypothetical protein